MNTCLEFQLWLFIAAVLAIQLLLLQDWFNLDFQNWLRRPHRGRAPLCGKLWRGLFIHQRIESAVCETFLCDWAEFIYTAKIRTWAPAKLMSGREQTYIRRHLYSVEVLLCSETKTASWSGKSARRDVVRAVNLKTFGWELVRTVLFKIDIIFVNFSCCEVEKTLVITMSGPLVLQMCVVLTLKTFLTGVEGAQVANAKVIRGNIRRDGKILTFI